VKLHTYRTTLGLFAVVGSLIIAIFVLTGKHNAQLKAQTEVHNAQLRLLQNSQGVWVCGSLGLPADPVQGGNHAEPVPRGWYASS
jgi:hypothetical protein